MPSPTLSVTQHVAVSQEAAFDYVADLTKHGEWAANDLSIVQTKGDGPAVGAVYASSADVGNLHFDAQLTVTEFNRPNTFAFTGSDKTGGFSHRFTFALANGGTNVTRTITFDLNVRQYLFYLVTYLPVRLPAARKAMDLLKARLSG